MKAVILCASVSHGNTRQVADVMGQVLRAPVVDPGHVDPAELGGYDLVGFGSGIYNLNFHRRLRDVVRALPAREGANAFVFATSGSPEPRAFPYTHRLARRLERRGYTVVDTFVCRGFDTWLPFRLVGGLQRGHPDPGDLAAAHAFAERLRSRVDPHTVDGPGVHPGEVNGNRGPGSQGPPS